MRRLARAVLLLTACTGDRLVPTEAGWRAERDSLHFEPVFVGAVGTQLLRFRNTGRVECDLTLATTPPFSVNVETLALSAGAEDELEVRFSPARSGPASGELVVTGCSAEERIRLAGEGLAPHSCWAATACATFEFDTGAGACRALSVPDGTPCSTPCLAAATCQAGICSGQFVSCDDGDPCTIDACGASGCIHLDASKACGRVPGCANVPSGSVMPVWEHRTTRRRGWEPVLADTHGSLYWLEYDATSPAQGELVSFTRDGVERFRTPFDAANSAPDAILTTDLVVITYGPRRFVEAFSQLHGTLAWKRDLRQELHPGDVVVWTERAVGELGPTGRIEAVTIPVYVGTRTNELLETWLVSLDVDDGSVRWKRKLSKDFWSLYGSGDNRWLLMARNGTLNAFSPTGTPDWTIPFTGPLVESGGLLFSGDDARRVADGLPEYTFASARMPPRVVGRAVGVRSTDQGRIELFSPETGAVTHAELAQTLHNVLLTGTSILLLEPGLRRLRELSPSGEELLSCELGQLDRNALSVTLADGRMSILSSSEEQETVLRVYNVIGLELADEGWVSDFGNMRRDMRPLP